MASLIGKGRGRRPSPLQYLFPNNDWFDQVPRLIAHHKECFFDVIPAPKNMGNFLMEIEAPACYKTCQFLHAQPSARHESAGNGFV